MKRLLLWLPLLLTSTACTSTPEAGGPYAPPTELQRNTHQAELLSREAADSIDAGDLEEAEALLRQSLTADLFYGPAHNNLGVVFLKQDKLYEAAQEFEWAKKLLPAAPDPRVNLALVLEQAGQRVQALDAWEQALAVSPGCVPAMQGFALLALSTFPEKAVDAALEGVALCGEPNASAWALARLGRGVPATDGSSKR